MRLSGLWALGSPSARTATSPMTYRVLHLSDLHFGDGHQFAQEGAPPGVRRLAPAIAHSLEQAGQSATFDVIVISGDIYNRLTQEERIKARVELVALRSTFACGCWVIVPGNHDLSWGADQADDRFVFFNNLLGELWPDVALPRDLPAITVIPAKGDLKPLAFIALDSCRLEGPVQHGLGYVGDDQLDAIAPALAAQGVTRETHTLIAVIHHHLLGVSTVPELPTTAKPEEEDRVVASVTLDATRTLRRLADAGVALLLMGHQHAAKVLTLYDVDWGSRPGLHVASAGTCGFKEANTFRHFFVWEIEDTSATALYMQQPVADPYSFVPLENKPVVSFT